MADGSATLCEVKKDGLKGAQHAGNDTIYDTGLFTNIVITRRDQQLASTGSRRDNCNLKLGMQSWPWNAVIHITQRAVLRIKDLVRFMVSLIDGLRPVVSCLMLDTA